MKKLRVGIVGSGIGASHAEGYAAFPDLYEVAAIADLQPERRDQVADKFSIPERTDSMEALFDLGLDHFIPGSKMPMQRIVRPEDRADLIAFLKGNT